MWRRVGGRPWRTVPRSGKPIAVGEVVQIHVAPVVDGYTVDLCRTVFCGDPPPEAGDALDVYLSAQAAGIAAAVPGAALMGVDAAMAEVLNAGGYGDAFLRSTFHGVGTEHEEAPIPGGHAVIHGEEKVEHVEVGMVLAIGNCGIYRDGFGVRAEDTVAVRPDGPEELTRDPKPPPV